MSGIIALRRNIKFRLACSWLKIFGSIPKKVTVKLSFIDLYANDRAYIIINFDF